MTDRRKMLAGFAAATAALSVGRAAKAEAPAAPGLQLVLTATVTIGAAQTPGPTPFGGRNRIPITGGHFEGQSTKGETVKGKVLPGGADWQLVRADGVVQLQADYMIEADDGALIAVHNRALISGKGSDFYFRCSPIFEAPLGKHEWLNKAIFVGTIEIMPKGEGVIIRVYQVT